MTFSKKKLWPIPIPKFCIFMFISLARLFFLTGSGFFKLNPLAFGHAAINFLLHVTRSLKCLQGAWTYNHHKVLKRQKLSVAFGYIPLETKVFTANIFSFAFCWRKNNL